MTAIATTIAGSDSGGGAGIQADLKTFSALGVYGSSVLTALTAQNTQGVTGIHDVEPDFITKQIDAVFSDLDVGAVKIGMLSKPDVIEAVAAGLKHHKQKTIILDPVMVATSGDLLLSEDAIEALVTKLFPLATLITPNLHEAARLTERPIATSKQEMVEQAHNLLEKGAKAVLLKGGHLNDEEATDLLTINETDLWLSSQRIKTKNTHGTGCTLSSAITAYMAKEAALHQAVHLAKTYISQAIAKADELKIGSGHGPVHHFHSIWKD